MLKTVRKISIQNTFQIGDKIMFQLMFRDQYNEDPKNPVYGWDDFVFATLRKIDGTEITDSTQFASRKYVCHNGTNSLQEIGRASCRERV